MKENNKKPLSLPRKIILFNNYIGKRFSIITNKNNYFLEESTKTKYFNTNLGEYDMIYLPINNQILLKGIEILVNELIIDLEKQYPNKKLTELSFEDYINFFGSNKEKNLLLHMINETKRIDKVKQAINLNDYKLFAKVMNQANYSLKTLVFDLNQHQEQIIIFSSASNALSTKIIDTGFIFLLESSETKAFINNFTRLYNDFYHKDINLIEILLN